MADDVEKRVTGIDDDEVEGVVEMGYDDERH